MYPLIKYVHNSILKHYLRYLFSKYLVSCNEILFLVTKGGFRRRALLALYSTRINCNLDRPKRD